MPPLELHVFDFDGTLFRSPHAPSWWNHSWIVSEPSLSMPCVPDVPGSDWWIGNVVARARKSISDPNVYAVLVTGRPAGAANFRYRVPELLKQAGLDFDEVHLNPGGETAVYKARTVGKILRKYNFASVRMWDDDTRNFSTVSQTVEADGLDFDPIQIHSTPHEVICDVEDVVQAVEEGWLPSSIIRHRLIQVPQTEKVGGADTVKEMLITSRVADRWLERESGS